jgi:hypothetical protein
MEIVSTSTEIRLSPTPQPSGGSMIQAIFALAGQQVLEDPQLALSDEQKRAIQHIRACRTIDSGFHLEICETCGYTQLHYNSCGDRNCPICQGIQKERWIDLRRSELLDCAYYHAVFTCPHELNPLFLANKKQLYSLFHRCVGNTLVELARDPAYLGATPGIIQLLHTWNQELLYHPHIHTIISGGGLTENRELKTLRADRFFIPESILAAKFRGKFLAELDAAWENKELRFSGEARKLGNSYEWKEFKNSLYSKKWVAFVTETFNGRGNAIEYLGRYAYRVAISDQRILSVSEKEVIFTARGTDGKQSRTISVTPEEFIRRFLLHVLPQGFQKIRYYGYLNNRARKQNLILLFNLQGFRQYLAKYKDMTTAEILFQVWGHDVSACPRCHAHTMIGLIRIRGRPAASVV